MRFAILPVASLVALAAGCATPRSDPTSLKFAIDQNDAHAVQRYLDAGASPHERDGDWPLVTKAAGKADPEVLRHMLAAGADPNARHPRTLETPIFTAVINERARNVDLLLEYGADINATDYLGLTTLHWATSQRRWEIMEHLLARGADPERKAGELVDFATPAEWGACGATREDRADVVEFYRRWPHR